MLYANHTVLAVFAITMGASWIAEYNKLILYNVQYLTWSAGRFVTFKIPVNSVVWKWNPLRVVSTDSPSDNVEGYPPRVVMSPLSDCWPWPLCQQWPEIGRGEMRSPTRVTWRPPRQVTPGPFLVIIIAFSRCLLEVERYISLRNLLRNSWGSAQYDSTLSKFLQFQKSNTEDPGFN